MLPPVSDLRETVWEWEDLIAAAERYGGGAARWQSLLERPRSVTADDLADVARRTLGRERAVVVQVGPTVG